MVTKYDVFEAVYRHRIPIKPKEVVSLLGKTSAEYNTIRLLLVALVKESLLTKTPFGFQAQPTPKAHILYNLIRYCLQNNVNYNRLLAPYLVVFIEDALHKGEITSQNCSLNPRTLQQYIDILYSSGLLLIISRKPWRVRVFYNSLLKNLLNYYDCRIRINQERIQYVAEIEQELNRFKVLLRKNEAKYVEIIDNLEMSFIYHSLTLEGNPLTLPETIKILKDKIIPQKASMEAVDEVRNYQNSMVQMLKDSRQKARLTIPSILEYHRLALQHRQEIAGKIRTVEVQIKGNPRFTIARVPEIISHLQHLLEEYQTFWEKKKKTISEIITFAAYFHNEFQHIHPFVDGNSRTTRLLTFYLLQSEGLPVIDLPLGLLDEYMNCTKGAVQREDTRLYEHLQKVILFNLKTINDKIK